MANALLEKLKKASGNQFAASLEESKILNRDCITTPIPAINTILGGSLDAGFYSGAITLWIGQSRTFKSLSTLICAKAYMDKYPDAILIFFDSEMGSSMDYFQSLSIDTSRVLHIPITNIEELKFEAVKQLETLNRGDHAIICIDSIGNLASKKEMDDAIDQKSVADMSRAKALTSFCRIITPKLSLKNIPMIAVNHSMQTMDFIPQTVMKGGQGIMLSADTIINVTRSQEKKGTDQIGWNFNMNVMKSRHSREKSKIPLTVTYDNGINKWSGLLDMALASGDVVKPSNGWYSHCNPDTGEVEEKKYREADTNTEDFWNPILQRKHFKDWVEKTFKVTSTSLISVDPTSVEKPNAEFTSDETVVV